MIGLKVGQVVKKANLSSLVQRYKTEVNHKYIRKITTAKVLCRDTPTTKGKVKESMVESSKRGWKSNQLKWEDLGGDRDEVEFEKSKPYLPHMDSPLVKKLLEDYEKLTQNLQSSAEKLPGQLYSIIEEPTVDSNNESQKYVDRTNMETLADEMNDLEELFYSKSNNWGLEPVFEKPDDDLLMSMNSNFKPGDIVGMSENILLVLHVGRLDISVMDKDGRFRIVRGPNLDFHFPGALQNEFCVDFINQVQGQSMVDSFLNYKKIEQFFPLAFQLLNHIHSNAFEFEMQRHYNLSQLYEKLALNHDYYEFNIKDVALDMLKRPATLPELFGFYSFFVRQAGYFDFNREKRNTFVAYPKQLLSLIPKVIKSARDQDAKFKLFMAKVTKLIDYRRSKFDDKYYGDVVSTESPAYTPYQPKPKVQSDLSITFSSDTLPKFTADDKLFIQAIWNYVVIDKLSTFTPLVHLVAAVLKPLGYPYVSCTYAHNFLKDIGVAKPWQNLNLLHRDNQFPSFPPVKATENFEDIYSKIRHDFGSLPVYTIDDVNAKEIDDGISLEKEADGSYWIHIHVADPTTIVPHDSALAERCLEQPLTGYLPETSLPMLPKTVTMGKCSLGGDSTNPKLTLTFSAKLDATGRIVDYKIRTGKINNILPILYDDLDATFNVNHAVLLQGSHPIKETEEPKRLPVQFDTTTKEDLKKLFELMAASYNHRIQDGLLQFDRPELDLTVQPNPLPNTTTFIHNKPNFNNYNKLPQINYRLVKFNPVSARGMVSQVMTIAGCVAATYCQDHNLPALYSTQERPDFTELPALQHLLDQLKLTKKAISYTDYLNLRGYLLPSLIKTQHGGHHTMGLPHGYIRVTSPLRRAVDLIMHWQIKHHLLHPSKPPLFTTDKLNGMLTKISAGAFHLSRLEQRSQKFWLLNLLQRFEADAKENPAALLEAYPTIIKRIQPETLVHMANGTTQLMPPQPVYSARIVKFHFDNTSWRVILEPLGVAVTFRANKSIRDLEFIPSDNDFQPNQLIEVVVLSLLRDNNSLMFVEPYDTKLN